jgi:hypothetical protein
VVRICATSGMTILPDVDELVTALNAPKSWVHSCLDWRTIVISKEARPVSWHYIQR